MRHAPASLEVERRDRPVQRLVIEASPFRIGRAPDSHLHVPEGHVSKQHAEIRTDGDGYAIADTGSRAGLLVNGQKVAQARLADGDRIELGDCSPVRIVFRAGSRRAPAALETTLAGAFADPALGGMAHLARFFEFSRKLGGGFSLDEVLADVVDLAIEVTGAERGMLILRRDDDGLDTKVARGAGGQPLPLDGLRLSETLVRQSLAATGPRVVADVGADVDLAAAQSIVSLELRSAVTLPLVRFASPDDRETATCRTFGVLYLDSRRRRGGLDGTDLGLLERLAQDASAVIENARLLREAEQKRRLDQELATAHEVQAALMPERFRSTPVFAIAGAWLPCHDLGGDYVGQFDLGGRRQAVVVADVCGKGVPAALLAATLQGALAAEIGQGRPLGEVVARVNRVHCRLAPVGKFITMVVALLEADGRLFLVDAGHCPALHVRQSGVQRIDVGGMALGLDEAAVYEEAVVRMQPGDALVLYTDGVIECEGPGRELFGAERLERLLAAGRGSAPADLVAQVTGAVGAFRAGGPVSDDLTVVVVRRN